MTTITAPYPPLLDSRAAALRLLPPVVCTDEHLHYMAACLSVLTDLDGELSDLVYGLTHPDTATGYALEALGDNVGEPRGALTVTEWRRIVLGRLGAEAARRDPSATRIYAMWRQLTGAREEDATIDTWYPGEVLLEAIVDYTPTAAWVQRARRVVRRGIRDGIVPVARVGSRSVGRWGSGVYGVSTYGWRVA